MLFRSIVTGAEMEQVRCDLGQLRGQVSAVETPASRGAHGEPGYSRIARAVEDGVHLTASVQLLQDPVSLALTVAARIAGDFPCAAVVG